MAEYKLWEALKAAKKYKWVELSHPLNNDSPCWSGIPAGTVELSKTIFDWGNPMLECLIQSFRFPGQFGTHIVVQGVDMLLDGDIPDGAFVALRTDWSKKWPDMNALSGIAEDGSENFPGWSLEALQYIYETRNAAANGHEALDTDASAVCAAAGDLVCERYVLNKEKLQVEVLCNLDQVQPAGAVLIVSYPRIENATGLPARVWAITE